MTGAPFDLCVAAPSAPSFIHFSELTTTSVNVSWGEPTFPNGIIEGYRLVYEPCTPVEGKRSPLASLRASRTPEICSAVIAQMQTCPPLMIPSLPVMSALTLPGFKCAMFV